MKKLLTVSFLTLGIVLISGCSFTEQKPVDNSAMTEQITALQQQMSGFSSQVETLKQENEQLKQENILLKKNIEEKEVKKEVSSEYNIKNWKMYLWSNILYSNQLTDPKSCTEWNWIFYAENIIAENNDYLMFSVVSSTCWYGDATYSYILDKSNNIATNIELGEKLYSYNRMEWDTIHIDVYDWWILGWTKGIMANWFYEKYDCEECWLKKIDTILMKFDELLKFMISDNQKPQLKPN